MNRANKKANKAKKQIKSKEIIFIITLIPYLYSM